MYWGLRGDDTVNTFFNISTNSCGNCVSSDRDIKGLIDGYNAECSKLSDISVSRKGAYNPCRLASDIAIWHTKWQQCEVPIAGRGLSPSACVLGYHVQYYDERMMEINMLKQENEKLKAQVADGSSTGGDDEASRQAPCSLYANTGSSPSLCCSAVR